MKSKEAQIGRKEKMECWKSLKKLVRREKNVSQLTTSDISTETLLSTVRRNCAFVTFCWLNNNKRANFNKLLTRKY